MPETTKFSGGIDEVQFEGALQVNTILLTRYKILGVLGGGGQGHVYQARDLNFPDAKRLVAIKEMIVTTNNPDLRASTVKTFQREANILATLAHPAIPKIYDSFEQNDQVYLVMEYINGSDLEAILTKTKSLPLDKILEWAIDLCDVLHYLHSHQPEPIIFRDMKPANIMIDHLGKVRLIDFGIAKVFVSGKKNTMIGTEGYSAPEQYKGDVNPLSDIYSLGATLHQVLTRQDPRLATPFSFSERPIDQFNDEASPELITIVEKALAFEAENRFQNCIEMKEALLQVRYGQPKMAPRIATNGDQPEDGTTVFGDVATGTGAITPKWTFKTEDEIRCSPVVYNNMVFIGSYDTNIWALNEEDGEFIWKFPTDGGIVSSPVVDQSSKLIMFGSEDYTFYALDYKNGRINWSYTTNDKIRGTARVAHGHVFFGSDDGKLYALVSGNGRYLWEYDLGSAVRSRPFVTNEMVIVGSEGGEVVGLELNGSRKWAFRAKRAITSSPYVDIEGICYVGSYDGFLYTIDAGSGFSMWRFRAGSPIISSPVVDGNLVFIGCTDGHMYAINTQTGKEKWKFNTEKAIVGSPIVHDERLYFASTNGTFYCLETRAGKEIWKFETESPITSIPFITEELILFGSFDHTIYALPNVSV